MYEHEDHITVDGSNEMKTTIKTLKTITLIEIRTLEWKKNINVKLIIKCYLPFIILKKFERA